MLYADCDLCVEMCFQFLRNYWKMDNFLKTVLRILATLVFWRHLCFTRVIKLLVELLPSLWTSWRSIISQFRWHVGLLLIKFNWTKFQISQKNMSFLRLLDMFRMMRSIMHLSGSDGYFSIFWSDYALHFIDNIFIMTFEHVFLTSADVTLTLPRSLCLRRTETDFWKSWTCSSLRRGSL